MFSRATYNSMSQFQTAEILRTPLHELCLQAKLLSIPSKKRRSKGDTDNSDAVAEPGETIAEFLSHAPEAPSKLMLDNAVDLLKTIDALNPSEGLTDLGHHLLDLPIAPRLGKMVLYSVVLKCLDPVLTIACTLAYKDPFVLPQAPELRKQALSCRMKFAAGTYSDHMCLLRAFQAWQKAKSDGWEKAFCEKNFLSPATMQMIIGMRTQLLGQLRAAGFVRARGGSDIRDLNTNSENWAVVKAAICASGYPNILRFDRDKLRLQSKFHKRVRFHSSSALSRSPGGKRNDADILSNLPTDWLVYDELKMPAREYSDLALAQCCTAVTPACIAFFTGPTGLSDNAVLGPHSIHADRDPYDSDSGNETSPDDKFATLAITDWIKLKMEPHVADLILGIRTKWYTLFLRRINSPARPWLPEDENILSTIINVLSTEDQLHNLMQPSGIGQRPRPMSQEENPKGFTGVRIKTPKKKTSETYRCSPRNKVSSQHSGYLARPQSGRLSATFGMDGSAESSPRTNESPLTLPVNFDDEPRIEPSVPITVLCVMCNSDKNLHISQHNGVWLACPEEEAILHSAFQKSAKVLLIVFLDDMKYLQGYARLSSPGTRFANAGESQNLGWEKDMKRTGQELSAYFSLEWLSKTPVHIEAPWTENPEKIIWEVEASEGQALIEKLNSHAMMSLHQFLPPQLGVNPNSQPFFPSQYSQYGMTPMGPAGLFNPYQGSPLHPMYQSQIPSVAQYFGPNPYQQSPQTLPNMPAQSQK